MPRVSDSPDLGQGPILCLPNKILDDTSDIDLGTAFGNHCARRISDIRPTALSFAYIRITWGLLKSTDARNLLIHWLVLCDWA